MLDPHFGLSDVSVTLGDTDIPVSAVEFDPTEVELVRWGWDEEIVETINEVFATGDDVQQLTISAPDREFRFPVRVPETRRRVNSDGPALGFLFEVPYEAHSEYHINPE
ncbi:hypothetical protein DJ71_22130 [Halorubrum sp. E3]|nr:hypothetical protein DJ71_22130 [Halorubrum sp. E3]